MCQFSTESLTVDKNINKKKKKQQQGHKRYVDNLIASGGKINYIRKYFE